MTGPSEEPCGSLCTILKIHYKYIPRRYVKEAYGLTVWLFYTTFLD